MAAEPAAAGHPIERLRAIMAALRDPDSGCPWDLEQTFASIAPHTLEECYELIDAIERDDAAQIREELGDVLFQVIFYSRLAEEQGRFDFDQLVNGLADKLLRRHPHVFPQAGAEVAAPDAAAVNRNWERIKAEERQAKAQAGVLDDVPLALPALSRAAKLQRRASRVGFDWQHWHDVLAKLDEERAEVEAAVASGDSDAVEEEVGDLLFVCVNLARLLQVDPERALRASNRKFERRFRAIEAALREQGRTPDQAALAELDALWDAAKAAERGANGAPVNPSQRSR